MHAVHRLFQYRKSISTTVFKARGQRVQRCDLCRLSVHFCTCAIAPNKLTSIESQSGFLLLMYDTEVLKPSNTGKLIADLVPDTYAFLWSRTVANPELLAVLNDEQWQPFVVFPAQYAEAGRKVFQDKVACTSGKRPLFIMLDGSWREAKKMFRKSPYLADLPIVSFDPTQLAALAEQTNAPMGKVLASRYQIRKAAGEHQFATAEVAARVLAMMGEPDNALLLDLWFDVFTYQYQLSVCQKNTGDPQALVNYQYQIQQHIQELDLSAD